MAQFIYSPPTPTTYSEADYQAGKPAKDAKQIRETFKKSNPNVTVGKITYKTISNNPASIENPLKNAPYGSAFMLNTKNPVYYLRFGYLLEYVKENIVPRVKISDTHSSNPPVFDIDTDTWDTYMYSLPNQISLDPRICIVRNDNFNSGNGTTKVFQKIQYFREEDIEGRSNQYSALPLNIYLNFDFITECLSKDERGDVNLYEFISSICTGLNRALGGINNLEPIIDETTNTLKIIDTTPIPGHSGENPEVNYSLQLYGYDQTNNYISNFIRKVDVKTVIDPGFATMITVGATAGGYIKGTEATAFSKWNTGLIDRYKEDFTPGKEVSVKKPDEEDEAEVNYVTEFLYDGYVSRYGFSTFNAGEFKLVDNLIEKNLSIVTEYYKYLLSKNKSTSGGTIGFIPFKLSFTMDGLSGVKIYNKLEINTEFLPKAYGKNNDLIITGVTHKLSDNDWETDIEATLMPKSSNLENTTISQKLIQDSINKVSKEKISSCKQIPSNSSNKLIKASDNTDAKAIGYVINQLEGGYFHPAHAWKPNGIFKSSFDYRKPKGTGKTPGNSGETLWGIDRPNGNHENSPNAKVRLAGIKFWEAVDKSSGFGKYKLQNKTTKKYNWNIKKYPVPKDSWEWRHNPGFKAGTLLADNAQIIIKTGFETNMSNYFGSHPLNKIIRNDGRLLFLYYRAWWNGPGWFQKFARNLKAKYDSGVTNVDKLICADLTYRYNSYSADFWKTGISKMKSLIDYNENA